MPLSDLTRETPPHSKRSFMTFKRILFDQHFHLSCFQNLTSLQPWKKCCFHQRKILSQHPPLLILTSAILSMKTNYFTCKELSNIACLCNFAAQEKQFWICFWFTAQASAGNQTKHPKWDIRRPTTISDCHWLEQHPINIWFLKPLCDSRLSAAFNSKLFGFI